MNYIHYSWPLGRSRKFIADKLGTSVDALSSLSGYREQEDLSVAAIRELIDWCELTGDKIVLIPNADEMQAEAANALLKTLEESENVMFVFNAARPLIPTIASRCTIKPFPINHDEIIGYINEKYPHYLKMDPGAAERAWEFSRDLDVIDSLFGSGGPMHILKELDQNFKFYIREPKQTLKLLGLLEEKSSDNYFDKYHDLMHELFGFILNKLFEIIAFDDDPDERAYAAKKMEYLVFNSQSAWEKSYAKGDFFSLMSGLCA